MKSFTQKEGKYGVLSFGLYKMFKEKFKGPDKRCESNVDYVTWLRVCKKFNQRILNSLLQGYIFKFPYRLGSLGIIQTKKVIKFHEDGTLNTDHLGVDWDKTLILWRKLYPDCVKLKDYKQYKNKPMVYYTNEHTDGRILKFHWKKKNTNIKNKSVYAFGIASQYKRALVNLINNNPNVQFCEKF
jgi:hypothetical protein